MHKVPAAASKRVSIKGFNLKETGKSSSADPTIHLKEMDRVVGRRAFSAIPARMPKKKRCICWDSNRGHPRSPAGTTWAHPDGLRARPGCTAELMGGKARQCLAWKPGTGETRLGLTLHLLQDLGWWGHHGEVCRGALQSLPELCQREDGASLFSECC